VTVRKERQPCSLEALQRLERTPERIPTRADAIGFTANSGPRSSSTSEWPSSPIRPPHTAPAARAIVAEHRAAQRRSRRGKPGQRKVAFLFTVRVPIPAWDALLLGPATFRARRARTRDALPKPRLIRCARSCARGH
jgi:hypothetical protein